MREAVKSSAAEVEIGPTACSFKNSRSKDSFDVLSVCHMLKPQTELAPGFSILAILIDVHGWLSLVAPFDS